MIAPATGPEVPGGSASLTVALPKAVRPATTPIPMAMTTRTMLRIASNPRMKKSRIPLS
jgi:hypothetical protein